MTRLSVENLEPVLQQRVLGLQDWAGPTACQRLFDRAKLQAMSCWTTIGCKCGRVNGRPQQLCAGVKVKQRQQS